MSNLIHIFRPLVLILLVFQVTVAFALPPGTHLNLCFGTDGHIEYSQDLCEETPIRSQFTQSKTISCCEGLNEDCFDLELGCNFTSELYPNIERVGLTKTTTKGNVSLLATKDFFNKFPQLETQTSNLKTSPLNGETLLSSHLGSIRTTVLLI